MADFENNDIITLSARMTYDTSYSIVNVWTVILDNGGPLSFSQVQTAIQNYLDTLYGYLTTYLVDNQDPSSIGVRNETQGTVFGSMSWGSWAGGTNTVDPTPTGVALLAFARTKAPRVQIRKYFGVFGEDLTSNGLWTGTVRGAAENAITYHIGQQTPDTGITWTGVAYNPVGPVVNYGWTVASSAQPAYQRRRKMGVGA